MGEEGRKKKCFPRERGKFSGNTAAAEDISSTDKELDVNGE